MSERMNAKAWDSILSALAPSVGVGRAVHRLLLVGPPGTGKSSAAAVVAAGREVVRVACHGGMCADDLVGGWRLAPDGRGGTATVWQDGPGVIAMREGWVLLLDEIDRAGEEVTPALHALLDDPSIASLRRGDGSAVVPAPGFAVIATTNGAPADLPEAVLDRFEIVLRATMPAQGALESLPAEVREVVRAAYSALDVGRWAWNPAPTARRAMALCALMRAGVSEREAAIVSLGDAFETILASVEASRVAIAAVAVTRAGEGGAA